MTADEAVESFVNDRAPEIVITDLDIPYTGAFELLRQLKYRKNGQRLIGIVMSERKTLDSAILALRHNAFDFLSKPVDEQELYEAVKRAQEHLNEERMRKRSALFQEILRFEQVRQKTIGDQVPDGAWRMFLSILSRAEIGAVSISTVFHESGLSRTTAKRQLKYLEATGLVTKVVDPDDRRSSLLMLTAAGRRICDTTGSQLSFEGWVGTRQGWRQIEAKDICKRPVASSGQGIDVTN